MRLDVFLVQQGIFATREKARAAIMAGRVLVDRVPVTKAGALISPSADLQVKGEDFPYVSRGGMKLAHALKEFGVDLKGRTVLDVGASTGGFTDCALQHGAAKVYAVDVGYGQLAWTLRQDRRVIVLERTNIRHLGPEQLGELAEAAVIDVSFISLELVLPAVEKLLRPGGEVIALIKPQFEAGREKVGKRGVVRDPRVHAEVIEKVIKKAEDLGLTARGLTYSPLPGPEGNIEYLLWLQKREEEKDEKDEACRRNFSVSETVETAHRCLKPKKD